MAQEDKLADEGLIVDETQKFENITIQQGLELLNFGAKYHNTIRELSVKPVKNLKPGFLRNVLPNKANEKPDTFENLMADFQQHILPGMVHWQSPKFHGYFATGFSIPCLFAEMLVAILGSQNFTWEACPVYTELESIVMDWLAKEMSLPSKFLIGLGQGGGGMIYTSASEATIVSVLAARIKTINRIKGELNDDVVDYKLMSKLVMYGSDQTHCSLNRASKIASIRLKIVETRDDLRMDALDLENAIQTDLKAGLTPFYVCSTFGTTDTCAFDDIEEIGKICAKYNLWHHVDAAYAGTLFLCEEYQSVVNGLEFAQSFVVNAHKLMDITFDCSLLWVDEITFVRKALISHQSILDNGDESYIMENKDLQLSLGCKFRSLKIWFHFRLLGTNIIKKQIRMKIELSHYLGNLITGDGRLDICYPIKAALICFRVKNGNNIDCEQKTRELYQKINEKDIFLSAATVKGKFIIRFSVGSTKCQTSDMDYAWDIIYQGLQDIFIPKQI